MTLFQRALTSMTSLPAGSLTLALAGGCNAAEPAPPVPIAPPPEAVIEAAPGTHAIVAPNLKKNASFEHVYKDGLRLPIFYGTQIDPLPGEGHRADAGTGIDDSVAWHGRRSLQLNYQNQDSERQPLALIHTASYRVAEHEAYTFSLYAQSGGGIEALRLQYTFYDDNRNELFDGGSGDLSIADTIDSGEFKRLRVTFTAPAGARLLRLFIHYWQPGTAWIDGLKLEHGAQPTPWVPGPTLAELGGPHCERQFAFAPDHPAAGDANIAAIGSLGPNTIDDGMFTLAQAIDGNLRTYWASNYPECAVPKDMVLTLRTPEPVKGMTVVYFNEAQAPLPGGGLKLHSRATADGPWRPQPFAIERIETIEPEPAVRWTLAFDEPVEALQWRLLFVAMDPAREDRATNRPAVRQVTLDYAERPE